MTIRFIKDKYILLLVREKMTNGDSLKYISNIFIHYNSDYWHSVYIFLILQSAFIVSYTQILINSGSVLNENAILRIIAIIGVAFSFFWLLVLNRKYSYTIGSQLLLESNTSTEQIWKNAKGIQGEKDKASVSSAIIVHTLLPILFAIFWIWLNFTWIGLVILIILLIIIIPNKYIPLNKLFRKNKTKKKQKTKKINSEIDSILKK